MADRVGQQLGSYRLVRLLGRGGFAEVYLGEHVYLTSYAALKVLHTALGDEEKASFLQEAQTLVHLSHPHIVRVFDFAIEEGIPFLVMEYAPHETLRQRHPAGSRLTLDTIVPYVQQVASALHYAHDQRLIHRDVKPENMLLNASDEVLLSDFGLALLAPQSLSYSTHVMAQVAGTSAYLAPEQLQGRPGPASDQYSLGIVVYEWLCGTTPFRGTFIEIVTQHLSLPPQPLHEFVPELTPAIEAIVLKALAKEPQQRFTDVQAFAAALTREYQGVLHLSPTLDSFPQTGKEALPAHPQAETSDSTQIPQPVWKMPALFTSFIGREQDMTDICELFKHPEIRLLTLLGPGGIGKTRLSVQVATAMRNFFPDGVCFIPLAAISDPGLMVPALAGELDIREVGEQSLLDQVKLMLRSKRLLLVLDNFEQIAAAALQLEELLVACPALKMLVTSRVVLHIQGEQEFPVPPLALPSLKQLPEGEALSQCAAVALFVQRARAVLPSFHLNSTNMRTIAEICVRLDGLPLAIELAAACSKLLSPQILLARLSQRSQVLTGSTRSLPERQQTLRNTFKWSYDLLEAREQQLFRRLAVFVGGWTLEAVEAICYFDSEKKAQVSALEEVAALLDKSLLLRVDQEGKEPRLQMLMTIREYGMECLVVSGEAEAVQRAHAHYYIMVAEQAEKERESGQQAAWLARLEWEQENVRAALSWLLERGEGESALRLSGALWWFWSVRGQAGEGRHWLERALAGSESIPAAVRAKALNSAGMLALNQDDYAQGEALCRESLTLYRELGDKQGMSSALYKLGLVAWWRDDYATARMLEDETLALSREGGDMGGMADALLILSNIAFAQGEYERARSLVEESALLFKTLDDKWGLAYVSIQLACVMLSQGDSGRARMRVEEALSLSRALEYKEGIAESLSLLGQLALQQGDAIMARSLVEGSLAIFRKLGDRRNYAKSLFLLAQVTASQDDHVATRMLYEQSMTIARELKYKKLVTSCLEGLAEVIASQGQPVQATQVLGAAQGIREEIGAHIPPGFPATYDRTVAATRSKLGEKVFATAWAKGRAMTVEQALAVLEHALEPEADFPVPQPTVAGKPSVSPTGPYDLTAREVAILRLIAQGWTDARIAEHLLISPRTVHKYLTTMYSKIGVSTRSAATRYAFEHKLV